MHFSTAFVLAAIPFLVSADPQPVACISIINKRSNIKKSDGSVDVDALNERRSATLA
jgi:hypothetical protein